MLQYSVLNIPYQKYTPYNHHLSDKATCYIYTVRLWWVGYLLDIKSVCIAR